MRANVLRESRLSLSQIKELFSKEKPDLLAIVIFGSPDPDAIASAMTLAFILKQLDVKTKIFAEKSISHPNNQMMVNLLDIPLANLADAKDIKAYAIVDYQYQELEAFPKAECWIHIDHHKEMPSSAKMSVVDTSAGSTSTMMTEYLKELEPKDSKQLSKITLGLAYGLYTDTASFLHANSRDFEALAHLKNFYDSETFSQLIHVKHSTQTMEVIKKALEHNQIKGTFAYSGIGFVAAEYRDSLAIAADFLLTQAGVSNVLVFAIIEEDKDYVNGCFRTTDSSMDVQKFMVSFVVNGTGGGRKNAGGFQEPLGFFDDCKPKDKVWDMVKSVIEEKIKTKITLAKVVEENGKAA